MDPALRKIKISAALKISAIAIASSIFTEAMQDFDKDDIDQYILKIQQMIKKMLSLELEGQSLVLDQLKFPLNTVLINYLEKNDQFDLLTTSQSVLEEIMKAIENEQLLSILNTKEGYINGKQGEFDFLLSSYKSTLDYFIDKRRQLNRKNAAALKFLIKDGMEKEIDRLLKNQNDQKTKEEIIFGYLLGVISSSLRKQGNSVNPQTRSLAIEIALESARNLIPSNIKNNYNVHLPNNYINFIIDIAKIQPKLCYGTMLEKTIQSTIQIFDTLLNKHLKEYKDKEYIASLYKNIIIEYMDKTQANEEIMKILLEKFIKSISYPTTLQMHSKFQDYLSQIVPKLGEKNRKIF